MPPLSPNSSSSAGITWEYPYTGDLEFPPHNRQILAHRVHASEELYGGAAGGGKTDWLLAEVLGPIFKYSIAGLILRRTSPELEQPGGIVERLTERIPRHIGRYNKTKKTWRFVGGGLLQLGFLDKDSDVGRYMGGEYGIIGWDQLEAFTEWQFRRMRHPLRIPKGHRSKAKMLADGYVPHMVATANPGGIGHAWVKGRFIDPAPPEVVWQPRPTEDEPKAGSRVFIPATIADNPGLAGTEYEENLDNLPKADREALKHGNWDVYAGQRFGDFRRSIHVVNPEDYPVPLGGVRKAIGVDYGLSAPFCALWGAQGPDGLVVIYRELYKADLTPTEQAELILASERPGERQVDRVIPCHIDPSTWARNPNVKAESGPISNKIPPRGSIAHQYRIAGLPVIKALNDRLDGVATVSQALRVRKDGLPRILIYSTCVNLIRTLPALPRDEKNPEDVDTHAEDHAYDALRYLLKGFGLVPPPPKSGMTRSRTRDGLPPKTATAGVRTQAL